MPIMRKALRKLFRGQSSSWMSILPVSGPYSMFHCLQSEQNSSGRCGRSCRTSLTENSVLRRAFTKAGQSESRTRGGGCQWGKCPLHTHPLPSCGGQQSYADRLCRWTGSQTRDAGIGSGLLRRTVRLPYRTAVLRSGLFLVFRRCHPRHTFEELREERRIGKVQFV